MTSDPLESFRSEEPDPAEAEAARAEVPEIQDPAPPSESFSEPATPAIERAVQASIPPVGPPSPGPIIALPAPSPAEHVEPVEPVEPVADGQAASPPAALPVEPVAADGEDSFSPVTSAVWWAAAVPAQHAQDASAAAGAHAAPPPASAPPNTVFEPTDAAVSQAIAELANTLEWGPADGVVPQPRPRRSWFHRAPRPAKPKRRTSLKRILLGFAMAFVVSAFVGLAVVTAVAIGLTESYANRVVPGVHAGSIDLSGLTRDQAMDKLQSDLSYLSKGEVTVTTPVGNATISYEQAGRKPDVEVMVDAAMAVGHSGNLILDAASMAHSAYYGESVPVVVQLDPTALARSMRQLVGASTISPQNAQATANGGMFGITAATTGRGIDEMAVESSIIDRLAQTNAPAVLQAGGSFVDKPPEITEKDAQDAITAAHKMVVNVKLEWTMRPYGIPNWNPVGWTVPGDQIVNWISFGTRRDGTYGPSVDQAKVAAYVAGLTSKAGTQPVEPHVVWDASGKPVGLKSGRDGVGIDPVATAAQVVAYLDALSRGKTVDPALEVATGPIHPQIASVDSVAGMVLIGSHTTTFYPDISNGMGKNIRQPALNLDGQVIGPGQQFSFLGSVGPIDLAHGFAMGGVIKGGKSDHTGAMGGGICSASTTLFNAAANAGVKIDERHPHYYYIDRYPVGRDATVYSDGRTTWDVKWTNDTPYPIVIRAWTTPGSKSTITIQLWSWPLGRTVTWTGGGKADIIKAGENAPIYTNTLPAGQKARAEYATDGFKTSVTRVVTDAAGNIIHNDTWGSSYSVVNGQLLIGTGP